MKYRITFACYAKTLDQWFENIEIHTSMDNAKLRASALNWQIKSVEEIF